MEVLLRSAREHDVWALHRQVVRAKAAGRHRRSPTEGSGSSRRTVERSSIAVPLLIRSPTLSGYSYDQLAPANYVLRARHGIGPPHPNGVAGRSGGTVSENGMDVSEEDTSRARNAVAA